MVMDFATLAPVGIRARETTRQDAPQGERSAAGMMCRAQHPIGGKTGKARGVAWNSGSQAGTT